MCAYFVCLECTILPILLSIRMTNTEMFDIHILLWSVLCLFAYVFNLFWPTDLATLLIWTNPFLFLQFSDNCVYSENSVLIEDPEHTPLLRHTNCVYTVCICPKTVLGIKRDDEWLVLSAVTYFHPRISLFYKVGK